MTPHDPIADIFAAYRPTLSDSDAFVDRLQQRLAAIDYMRARARRTRRAGIITLAVTFTVGLLCGLGAAIAMQYMPAPTVTNTTANIVLTTTLSKSAIWLAAAATAILTGLTTFRLTASALGGTNNE